MKFIEQLAELQRQIPGKASAQWPQGERFATALAHGSMSVEYYAPLKHDPQTPHTQDELYLIHAGTATLLRAGQAHACTPGTVIFVPAGMPHHFENFSDDFATWVVFWGPSGGEVPSPTTD